MDSRLPARIIYFTGWLAPEMEGISKEVFTLASHFKAPVIGISKLQPFKMDLARKAFGFSAKRYYLAKSVTFMLSRLFKIVHVYDSLDNWIYLSSVPKNTILTGVVGEGTLPIKLYRKMAFVVVDDEEKRLRLIKRGIDPEKIKIIYPGIDIKPYLEVPQPPPVPPFRVLFASSPPTSEELKPRGVFDLLEAAARLPKIEFIFLWRPWGDSFPKIKEEIEKRGLKNVRLICEKVQDIRKYFKECHAMIAPFREGGGKSCPTSILEALASGRPVILGPGVGIEKLIEERGAGLYYNDHAQLPSLIERLSKEWEGYNSKARELALNFFSKEKFISSYYQIYKQILGN